MGFFIWQHAAIKWTRTSALLAPNITFDKDMITIIEPVGGKNALFD